ncbi:carboxypeptidase-like regulatory domain-containing protein [Lacinutrix neustonica]|uniref:carboxypeptidase-like regulatory domain-containing protein n=1 Tax=Lacinutrix neustonica TaxID=2980107 RepID=UPI0028BD1CD4|nr:carboxypeptidase-like regulatory domain-containing protein [Lacinutrix neustonica]
MKQFLLIITLLTSLVAFAQETGSVYGKVSDKDYNDEALPQCNVAIKGTSKGETTDFDGLYSIANLEPGSYTLEFSFVGYETQNIPVQINAGEKKEINVSLAASTAKLEEVVLQTTTKRESETALLLNREKGRRN